MYNFLFGKKNQLVKGLGGKTKGKKIKEGNVKREEGMYYLPAGFCSHRKTKLTFFGKKYVFFPP